MESDKASPFRERSLKATSEADDIDRYLKVTTFGSWMMVAAAALVLAALVLWLFWGKIGRTIRGAGYAQGHELVCYVTDKGANDIPMGAQVDVEGSPGTVTRVGRNLCMESDVPYEILYLIDESRWYRTLRIHIDGDVDDGLYKVTYSEPARAPFTIVWEDE